MSHVLSMNCFCLIMNLLVEAASAGSWDSCGIVEVFTQLILGNLSALHAKTRTTRSVYKVSKHPACHFNQHENLPSLSCVLHSIITQLDALEGARSTINDFRDFLPIFIHHDYHGTSPVREKYPYAHSVHCRLLYSLLPCGKGFPV